MSFQNQKEGKSLRGKKKLNMVDPQSMLKEKAQRVINTPNLDQEDKVQKIDKNQILKDISK